MPSAVFPQALLAAAIMVGAFVAPPAGFDSLSDPDIEAIAEQPTYPYYVEFRVGDNSVCGHTYIAYGRLNAAGQPLSTAYADIHPTGGLPSLVLGHVIPMKAATTPVRETPHRRVASRYRRALTAADHQKLVAVIARIRAAHHDWSIVSYNCNDLAVEVARRIGLQTPSTLALPYDFHP